MKYKSLLFYFAFIFINIVYNVYSHENIKKEIVFPITNVSNTLRPKFSPVVYTFIKYHTNNIDIINYFLENDDKINDYFDFINYMKNYIIIDIEKEKEKMINEKNNINYSKKFIPENDFDYKICEEFLGNLQQGEYKDVKKQDDNMIYSIFNNTPILRTILEDLRETYPVNAQK
jgi:hypothetical protein